MNTAKRNIAKLLTPAALLGAALLPLAAHAQAPDGRDGRPDFQGRPDFRGADPDFRGARAGVHWEGDVDDTTLVSVHRRDVQTRTVSGKGAENVNARLFGFLPDRPASVFLSREAGRGRVRVVQQPSPENDWTAVVRLRDPQPGRGHYAFDLVWQAGADRDDRDFRGADGDFRGADGDFRGADGDFRGADGDFRGADGDFRGADGDFRGR